MTMKKFFVGVKAVIRDEQRGCLLIQRSSKDTGPGHWDLPGGRMEDNETFSEALTREVAEELPGSSLVSVGKQVGAFRLPFDVAEDTSLVLLFFEVAVALPREIALSEEHEAYKWVRVSSDIPQEGVNEELARILGEITK